MCRNDIHCDNYKSQVSLQESSQVDMNSFDLRVRRQRISPELPSNTALFVATKGDTEVRVLTTIDLWCR
jgi:hypothetical protein